MRRTLSSALLCAFLTLQLPAPLQAEGIAEAITALQNAGIIDLGPIIDLRLQDGINRAEALKVILRGQQSFASSLSSTQANMPPMSLFPDVDQRAWYAAYVELGFRLKLITGYPDGNLRPQNGVKTEEAAAMLTRALGDDTASAPFMTSPNLPNLPGQWYTGMLSVLISKNAVGPNDSLQAGRSLTRGQFFLLVHRMRVAHGLQAATQPLPVVPSPVADTASARVAPVENAVALQYASQKPFSVSIPSLGITDLTITHPDDAFTQKGVLSVLKDGVGHLFAYPGEKSRILIYGHSSGYPWDLSKYTKIFRGINKIQLGAHIYVTYKGKLFVYEVSEKKTIPAKDRSMFESATNAEELILYTCWPPDSITERYLVHAVPVQIIALK